MFRKIKHLHFVGVGGTGMCGIAEILLNMGYKISGSDIQLTEVTDRLIFLGANVIKGHKAENIEDADVVVISSAIRDDNPEVLKAKEKKIPVIRRAEMLAELMRVKYGVGIAGTHGKTTTTSMIGEILLEGGLDPTIIVGGRVKGIEANAKIGRGEFLVAEADEFDRSFLKLTPTIAVITTIESDHLDYFRDLEEIKDAFVTFANKVPFYGSIITCLDEESVLSIIPKIERRLITYGFTSQSDLRARDVYYSGHFTSFSVFTESQDLGKIKLQIPGKHNVLNALASIAVGLELGIPFPKIRHALEKFSGVHRRFEIKGELKDIMVIDDYAHHPTEIQATLKAARDGWQRRIIAIFQPHLYSRTQSFYHEFGKSFFLSDILIVTDIYPARENPIPNVTGELIAKAAKEFGHKNVIYLENKEDIPMVIKEKLQPGDMVITMGAGDIWKVADDILKIIGDRNKEYYKK